ncbi:MAG: ferrous iron transport protein B [Ruminococcus sp.]|nr:ferrous iron transport protein B [Ruminococcus sp.]
MGLTNSSIGIKAVDTGLIIKKQSPNDKVIALAGNPNVGKSTIFNALTGLNQHTGNWPGKTVTNAQGYYQTKNNSYVIVDIPGTYSLMPHSAEEEVARDFICFGSPDIVIVVCDATCLERNLNLVLQTIEITNNVIICVNLIDEANRKNIEINCKLLSDILGVPVFPTAARNSGGLTELCNKLDEKANINNRNSFKIKYCNELETAISIIENEILQLTDCKINSRWLSMRLIDCDPLLLNNINSYLGYDITKIENINSAICKANEFLTSKGFNENKIKDKTVSAIVSTAENICRKAVTYNNPEFRKRDIKIDNILTSKLIGYPIMIVLLAVIFWITIVGANYPSQILSDCFSKIQVHLTAFFKFINVPDWLHGIIVLGMYRTLTWVVSVMLPPMAIFFPLFTLLEDSGYLPRIAYNLDKPFRCCNACGKQALTMCMGFGCNAAGIVGCRIIDSPRERLLAILTNNFVPCNGRFPTLIMLISMFFIGTVGRFTESALSALLLTAIIILSILTTFAVTKILSATILKGVPSSFTLEMPPYRTPQIGKVIVRSIFDRTLFVLGRSVIVAAPAGAILWLMANITIDNATILNICADFLDPFARLMGLDGVILIAFILGFPANEIVLPIIIMAYTAQGSLVELSSINVLKELFVSHGWTSTTALCVIIFSLMHWPCSTALLTVKKETASIKWTLLAAVIPTICGIVTCMLINLIFTFSA